MPHSKKSQTCKKERCLAFCVPHVRNPNYSVEILSVNPLATYRKCKKFHKVKQTPFFPSTVDVDPIPVAPFY